MDDPDFSQRAVLGMLLEKHPELIELDDLAQMLPDVPGVPDAVELLVRDGVATRLGQLVGASRAAVRTDQLSM